MRAPDPVAFTLFGMDIMWYGVLIGTGFVLAIILCYKRAPKHGIQSDHILDFAHLLIPASIIGARAYYVLFSWENYAGDLWKILNIRNGGLAIHGGIIAGFIVGLLVCKYRQDRHSQFSRPGTSHSCFWHRPLGRWGNFFNLRSPRRDRLTCLWFGLMDSTSILPFYMNHFGALHCSGSYCGWINAELSRGRSPVFTACFTRWREAW